MVLKELKEVVAAGLGLVGLLFFLMGFGVWNPEQAIDATKVGVGVVSVLGALYAYRRL